MSESKDAVALLAFHNAEIDYFGPKLIGHDFCRGSLSLPRDESRRNKCDGTISVLVASVECQDRINRNRGGNGYSCQERAPLDFPAHPHQLRYG